ncbi:hypothetical protein [Aeromicrobium sp. Root495]|uniref:hypothetical protein n=1 Tax=Aeromicrobium sp. Root495 TaxID=1736550 RepID=UPI0012E84EBB|nr:hypothetical protein [Aeromicrobium sp. Root495]
MSGTNLEGHLEKTHHGAAAAHHARWGGPERVTSRWLLGLALGAAALVAVYAAISGAPEDRVILGTAAVASLTTILWGAVAWGAPLFPGVLTLDERGAVLRHTFGLVRRRLGSIDEVVIGTAMESRPSGDSGNDDSYASIDVRVGIYLQLRHGRRQITVHCRTAGVVRSTWSGWRQGKKRKRLDITLDPAEFVALQLALWERGSLTPR